MCLRLLLAFVLLVNYSYGQEQKATAQKPGINYSVFLIGDAGEPLENGHKPNFQMLNAQLVEAGAQSMVLFLGDNIYSFGMPKKGDPTRKISEEIMEAQFSALDNYQGKTIFIPGNHDWEKGKENGWEQIKNEEEYVTDTLGPNAFFPKGGCPGPVLVEINDDLALVIIDTQWLLHKHSRPGKVDGCANGTLDEITAALDDILNTHKDKTVIVASHHPMYTYGPHGGTSTLKDHIFPLTMISDWMYIPVPILGTMVQQLRKHKGHIQDATNKDYKVMRDKFVGLFAKYGNVVHVAGHEHSLQFIQKDGVPYVVSGSGSKTTHVKTKKLSKFSTAELGFARLDFMHSGKVNLTYWKINKKTKKEEIAYQTTLY